MQNTTLSALRTQLGLKLSPLRLDALLSVFRAEKREPSEQELRTLDALLYDSIMTPSASSLTSFQTEDTDTAAIFSDLIAKSKDIRGKTPLPTPASALRVASEALARKGICPPAPQGASGERLLLISRDNYPLLSLYGLCPTESVPPGDTPWRMVRAISSDPWFIFPAATGDLCSLILTPEDEEDGDDRLLRFFSRKEIQTLIHQVRAVRRETYLEALLSLANGYDIDLSALPALAELRPAEAVQKLPRGYLVCTDQQSTRSLMEEAQAEGLSMAAFARVNDTQTLTFLTHGVKEFSFPTARLRDLAQPRSLQLRTANQTEGQEQNAPIQHAYIGEDTLAYCTLAINATLLPNDVHTAFEKTLSSLIEHGGDRKSVYAIIGMGEHAEVSPCGVWSAVLGLHRAMCEQNVPAFAPVLAHATEGQLMLCLVAKTRLDYDIVTVLTTPSETAQEAVSPPRDSSQAPDLPDQTAKNP